MGWIMGYIIFLILLDTAKSLSLLATLTYTSQTLITILYFSQSFTFSSLKGEKFHLILILSSEVEHNFLYY